MSKHPPPWRWKPMPDARAERGFLGYGCLEDGNGEVLAFSYAGTDGGDWPRVLFKSVRVRALTEAAPQLEDVLVRLVARYDDDPEANGYQDLIDEARALLKQIEERSRG